MNETERNVKQQTASTIVVALFLASTAGGQAPAPVGSQPQFKLVDPTFSAPGVVDKPARLVLLEANEERVSISLDRDIEEVQRVVSVGSELLVVGKAKYGWRLQRIGLSGQKQGVMHCRQLEPQVSPDSTRAVFVASPGVGGMYWAGSNVVEVLDIASGQTAVVFPEENVLAKTPIVSEYDQFWHNVVWGNFLWEPDGKGVVFVAARGIQWWDLDLCLVDLSNGRERPAIARRRLDFSRLFKKGHGPSESCKYVVKKVDWASPGVVRVSIGGCFFMTSTSVDVEIPDLAGAFPLAPVPPAQGDFDLEKIVPGGFRALGRTPWEWVGGYSPDGSVLSVLGERLSYTSDAQEVDAEVRYAVFESVEQAAQAVTTLRNSNRAVDWQELSPGSAPPCRSGGCWSSSARGLYRLLTQSGRVAFLITAYGRDVLPGEPSETNTSIKEADAVAFAEAATKQAAVLVATQ